MGTVTLWKGGKPVEVPRGRVLMTDRSRVVQRKKCEQKRWLEYHWGGRGLKLVREPEDLALGKAVHAGLESAGAIIQAGGLWNEWVGERAGREAKRVFEESASKGLILQDQEEFDRLMPEVTRRLVGEQAALAEGLVYAWCWRALPQMAERFDVEYLEMEIPWALGDERGGKQVGVMSRVDKILRDRADGSLWPVSYKTTKRFSGDDVRELVNDPQSFAEGLAVRERFGQAPHSTLYYYLVKGDKSWDQEVMAKRYTTGLVRPYTNWDGTGEPMPDQFSPVWKWTDEDGKERRLGKGWRKIDVWEEFELGRWLEWLRDGVVRPELGRDWLAESLAGPVEVAWDAKYAERWADQTQVGELKWDATLLGIETGVIDPTDAWELNEANCWSYNKRCHAYGVCWEGTAVEAEVARGRYETRVPNHPDEVAQLEFEGR